MFIVCQGLKILNNSYHKEAAEDTKMTLNKFISGRKTDNAMAKERKMKKKKPDKHVYKTLYRKLKTGQYEPHQNTGFRD